MHSGSSPAQSSGLMSDIRVQAFRAPPQLAAGLFIFGPIQALTSPLPPIWPIWELIWHGWDSQRKCEHDICGRYEAGTQPKAVSCFLFGWAKRLQALHFLISTIRKPIILIGIS